MASTPSSLSPPGTPPRQSFVNRYLDATETLSEVLFGLIMVLIPGTPYIIFDRWKS